MSHFLDSLRCSGSREGRRRDPRIPALGSFCTEITDHLERYSIVSEISPMGLRLHRPYRGGHGKLVQLEFDLPETDEVIWATGRVSFDSVWQAGEGQLLHTTGIELVAATSRHLRMLRDYAMANADRSSQYANRRRAA